MLRNQKHHSMATALRPQMLSRVPQNHLKASATMMSRHVGAAIPHLLQVALIENVYPRVGPVTILALCTRSIQSPSLILRCTVNQQHPPWK